MWLLPGKTAVSTEAERDLASHPAKVEGARSVRVDDVYVAWWQRNAMRAPENEHVRPADVEQAVLAALKADRRLMGFRPEVAVRYGIVELRGMAPVDGARRAAIEDTLNTVGVRRVDDKMTVR